MDIQLNGKRALVCGASQGIGRATALALAEQGASVTLTARTEDKLKSVCEALSTAADQRHGYFTANFDRPDDLHSALDKVLPEIAPVHILVNNSGGPPPGPAHTATPADYLQGFTRHLICNQILLQALLPGMRDGGYGRIVNIISTSVKEPITGLGVSNTVRGEVASWAKTLAAELGPMGITVNNVLPGFTRTVRLANLFEGRAEKQNRAVEAVEAEARETIPLRRFAEPEELAQAIAFLASPAAGYINGINLPVDGGRLHSL
jgi:3-oxoacyl-[acyl-carrier protein] reductase